MAFLSVDLNQLLVPAEFVPAASRFVLTKLVLEAVLVAPATELVLEFLPFSFGIRVVTLAIGTQRTFVLDRVSISAVQDMPGRKASFSLIRIFTLNFVAS